MTGVQGEIGKSGGLRFIGGKSMTPEFAEAWGNADSVLSSRLEGFWDLLHDTVSEPSNPGSAQRISEFATKNGTGAEPLVRALQVCDLLIGGAVTYQLSEDDLRRDLVALSGSSQLFHEDLLRLYNAVRPHLQARVAEATLSDHGKLLVGLDWRVDTVTASDRSVRLETTVVFLTLRYRDGDRLDRITLQLTPESMRVLKAFSDRFDI